MINLARQPFVNPFQSTAGYAFQPGAGVSAGRCPLCGNVVGIGSAIQPQTAGFTPAAVGAGIGQPLGGFGPTPHAIPQGIGLGQINPLAAQFGGVGVAGVNPMVGQLGTNWPLLSHHIPQGVGGRTGAFGIDPRYAFGAGQQFGYTEPTLGSGLNPAIAGDPIALLLAQQWAQQAQQQLPIRPLIGGQQGVGGLPTTQFGDPYRMLIETQLISQLANNPLYQLQRAYGGVPEATGLGVPFGTGQQFNPLFGNVPFYG